MTLKRRLKAIEKIVSPTERPKVLFFATYYERKEGGEDFASARAVVTDSTYFRDNHVSLHTEAGETLEKFQLRVCDLVEEKTGVRPVNAQDLYKDKKETS